MHDILELATNQDVRLQCIKTCVNNNTNIKQLTQILLRLGSGAEYCDQFVCLSLGLSVCVCLSAGISLEPLDRSSRNFCADPLWPCGRGSVLLRRRCDVLCRPTSGFIFIFIHQKTGSNKKRVTFGRSGPFGNAWKARRQPTMPFDVYAYTFDMCTNKVYLLTNASDVAIPGRGV